LNYIKTNGIRKFITNENNRWKCNNCGVLICIHLTDCLNCGSKREKSQHGNAQSNL
jgi:uncharacterized OB-fold protein